MTNTLAYYTISYNSEKFFSMSPLVRCVSLKVYTHTHTQTPTRRQNFSQTQRVINVHTHKHTGRSDRQSVLTERERERQTDRRIDKTFPRHRGSQSVPPHTDRSDRQSVPTHTRQIKLCQTYAFSHIETVMSFPEEWLSCYGVPSNHLFCFVS